MKKMKLGFTLAEVLITLGIIGVIAALVMPTVMTNYTYKTVGVKIGKFLSQLESATRPYVINYGNFSGADLATLAGFAKESFLVENSGLAKGEFEDYPCTAADLRPVNGGGKSYCQGKSLNTEVALFKLDGDATELPTPSFTDVRDPNAIYGSEDFVVTLKDGTQFGFYEPTAAQKTDLTSALGITAQKEGDIQFGVNFFPNVKGIPAKAQKGYSFVVTELGYVYPDIHNDKCIKALKASNFEVNPGHFNGAESACGNPASKNTPGNEAEDD